MREADGSGELDLDEIVAAAPLLDLTPEEAVQLFNEIDTDGGGTISKDEFLAYYKNFTRARAFGRAANATAASLQVTCVHLPDFLVKSQTALLSFSFISSAFDSAVS